MTSDSGNANGPGGKEPVEAPVRFTTELTEKMGVPEQGTQQAKLVRQGGEGEVLAINPAREMVVGSAVDCDLWINDLTVSRHHFAISRDGLAFLVRDLGSTNGTLVDGVRIKEVYLKTGSRIQAGKVHFVFELN